MKNATSTVLEVLLCGVVLISCGAVAGGLYLGLVAQAGRDPGDSSAFALLLFACFNALLAFAITTSLLLTGARRICRVICSRAIWVGALLGGAAAAVAVFSTSISDDLYALEQLPALLASAGIVGLVGLGLMIAAARPSRPLDSPGSRPTLIRGAAADLHR